jgi:hypothetical protein
MINKELISLVMSELGKRGGKIGGKRSLVTMTSEERTARAKKASLAAARKRTEKRLARLAAAHTATRRRKGK